MVLVSCVLRVACWLYFVGSCVLFVECCFVSAALFVACCVLCGDAVCVLCDVRSLSFIACCLLSVVRCLLLVSC